MVLITLSSFLSVTVINIYMREDQNNKVPGWLRKVPTSSFSGELWLTHCAPPEMLYITVSFHIDERERPRQMLR